MYVLGLDKIERTKKRMVNDNQANQGKLPNKSAAQLNQLRAINWHNHQNFQSCVGFLILK